MQDTEEFKATSLEDVFGDEPTSEAPTEEIAPSEEPPAEEPVSTGDETPAQPDPDAPPASEEPEESWTKAKALDETRKRQAAEQRAAELERQLQEFQQQQTPQAEPEEEQLPDPWDDPEGYQSVMDQRVETRVGGIKSEVNQALFDTKVAMTEEAMRTSHEDYDEVCDVFKQMVANDPSGQLLQQVYAHPNPASFAYETGQRAQFMQEAQDPAAYREKIKAEVRAEMEAETNGTATPTPSPAATAPTSLASVPSAPPAKAGTWEGPKPLAEILD